MSVGAIDWAFKVEDVNAPCKLVLLALANFANNQNQSWASQSTISKMTCLSTKTIRKALSMLEADGFISRQERRREDGSRSSDIITLNLSQTALGGGEGGSGGGELRSGGVGNDVPGGGEPRSPQEPSTEPSVRTKTPLSPPKGKKGTRLSEDWIPSEADRQKAEAEGLTEREIERAATEFRNYWCSRPGQGGVKLDWSRTWHNWVIRHADGRRGGRSGMASRPAQPGGGRQGVADFAEIVARRRGYA
ncbi:MAG: helix-turn-helix domain-containing protein [Phenylobacterium sp.]|uniref:helix-turn-helix domain-containing protein n=1 Tax=Phenylobacterium sp. TaxID=1871053 RepID=UPI002A1B3209|nr:helix-turn-helix domain-containing protein [Phenylobacterium sp.]MCA6305271.1 helix-turn-helix domain-containing protein [Phenylobacterium sp.]MCA6307594.1 helix-turn-helix domain-containing protein [Phenylobacterium sp.]MCA6318809.1 helix-turn-helix domain-containing protein [Phenylobacterium sp.]